MLLIMFLENANYNTVKGKDTILVSMLLRHSKNTVLGDVTRTEMKILRRDGNFTFFCELFAVS